MICPWCVLAHIICTSMSIPRTIQLERMTHMYVHTRYQVCTYVLHLYSRYQLYRLLYYIYSWSPFKHLGTQNIEHNRYSTATSPPLLPPPRSLVSGLSSAMLTLCSTGWARRPHASLSAVGNHFLRLTNLTSSKKNGYGRRKSVRNCFAVMLVESERSLSFSSCAQPHVPLSRLFLGQRVSFIHTRRVLVHVVVEVLAFDLFESGQSYSQSSSWQEVIDTAHCGHRMLVRASHGHGQRYRYATLTRGEQQQQ